MVVLNVDVPEFDSPKAGVGVSEFGLENVVFAVELFVKRLIELLLQLPIEFNSKVDVLNSGSCLVV